MSRSIKRLLIIIVILMTISIPLLRRVLFVEINNEKYCILSSKIVVHGFVSRNDTEMISRFKSVKDLSVSSIDPDISFAKHLTRLESLSLWISDIENRDIDFSPLNSCKKIKEFGITCNSIDGSVIANMHELRKIVIHADHITNSSQIWECSELETANIILPSEGLSLKGTGNLEKLNYLYLSGDGEVSDASELCECNSLTELGIVCEIEDTSFLKDMPNLEKLYIKKGMIDQKTINALEDKNVEITFY